MAAAAWVAWAPRFYELGSGIADGGVRRRAWLEHAAIFGAGEFYLDSATFDVKPPVRRIHGHREQGPKPP